MEKLFIFFIVLPCTVRGYSFWDLKRILVMFESHQVMTQIMEVKG